MRYNRRNKKGKVECRGLGKMERVRHCKTMRWKFQQEEKNRQCKRNTKGDLENGEGRGMRKKKEMKLSLVFS